MLNQAIKMAKGSDEEKAMQSVSMPKSLKESLVELANGNNVSTNALIVSILSLALQSDSISSSSINGGSLVKELQRLEKRKSEIGRFIQDNSGLDMEDRYEASLYDELNSISSSIETIKGVLS